MTPSWRSVHTFLRWNQHTGWFRVPSMHNPKLEQVWEWITYFRLKSWKRQQHHVVLSIYQNFLGSCFFYIWKSFLTYEHFSTCHSSITQHALANLKLFMLDPNITSHISDKVAQSIRIPHKKGQTVHVSVHAHHALEVATRNSIHPQTKGHNWYMFVDHVWVSTEDCLNVTNRWSTFVDEVKPSHLLRFGLLKWWCIANMSLAFTPKL